MSRRYIAKARGALLGLAVGDAMGATTEFRPWCGLGYPHLAVGHTKPIGGGAWRVAPGQTTDDTQMAVALARALFASGGVHVREIADSYIAWRAHAFDVGSQTSRALSAISLSREYDPRHAARAASSPGTCGGNGALMRAGALIGWILARNAPKAHDRRLFDLAAWECEITHPDPVPMIANVAFVASAVRAALLPRESGINLITGTFNLVAEWATETGAMDAHPRERVHAGLVELGETFRAAKMSDPCELRPSSGATGWCHTALSLAWWHLVRDTSYKDAIIDLAARGGDADTNCAIAGALLGARGGDVAIPASWRKAVLEHVAPGELGTTYHPRQMLALVA